MKLQNNKTGLGGRLAFRTADCFKVVNKKGVVLGEYKTLAELCEEWEDASKKEPKEYWFLNSLGEPIRPTDTSDWVPKAVDYHKQIGNVFSSKEEAELAVEKLKAWKRLKDNGFGFGGYTRNHTGTYEVLLKREIPYSHYEGMDEDIDTIFGGEE